MKLFMATVVLLTVLQRGSGPATKPHPWPEGLPEAGSTLSHVQAVLGRPDRLSTLATDPPNVLTKLEYKGVGLEVTVHKDNGVTSMNIHAPWARPIFGIKIGDLLAEAREKVPLRPYLTDGPGRPPTMIDSADHEHWFFYTREMALAQGYRVPTPGQDPPPAQKIVLIRYHDPAKHGWWIQK